MAGARTQGVGRGVNWGAFGSMGQQYAQIGRTIESGGEALGKGIGGGLAAIGGAIERKKVRDQQAAERQAARADEQARFDTLRGDRLAENATDNDFRERQFSALLAEQRADNARLEGEATRRMLSNQADFFLRKFQETQDPADLQRATDAQFNAMNQGGRVGVIPSVSVSAAREYAGDPAAPAPAAAMPPVVGRMVEGDQRDEAAARSYLSATFPAETDLNNPGVGPDEISMMGVRLGRLPSMTRIMRDHFNIDQARNNIKSSIAREKNPLALRALIRSDGILETAAEKNKAKLSVLNESLGMASKQREQNRVMAERAAVKQQEEQQKVALKKQEEAARIERERLALKALEEGRWDDAVATGGVSAEAVAAAKTRAADKAAKAAESREMDDADILDNIDRPRPGDVDKYTRKPVDKKDAAHMDVLTPGRLKGFLDRNPNSPKKGKIIRLLKEVYGIDYAPGTDQAGAALGAARVAAILESVGGDRRKAADRAMRESPVQTAEVWAEIKTAFGLK